ncbi:putative DNA-binding domain-containing protein [Neptunomonas sp.]|uniref:HvfC/BufC family peptide modification chaperone n=1 Tax=Neptunomonas sp. TaxID=1971898 RepID=UPI0035640243
MSVHHYIDAFTRYLRSGDASAMGHFCENSDHIKRLAVYRNGFYKGCVDALAANFPVCQKLLGSDSFRNVARLYVDHFPPQQGTLVGYGRSFPDFLADYMTEMPDTAELSLRSFKAKASSSLNLPDIARLDYAWLTSLMSADAEKTLTAENVTRLMEQGNDLEKVRVKLNASVLLFRVGSGSLSEWISLKIPNNGRSQETESSAAGFVMFWRAQGAVQARALSKAEVALMQALQGEEGKGRPLGEAFDAALAVDENFEVSDVFSACLQNELLDIEMLECRQ